MATFPGLYRVKTVKLDTASVTAQIPQVYGESTVTISEFVGGMPASVGMGWVTFRSGDPAFPVWHGGGGGGGGTGTVTDTLWVGTDAPEDESIEMWYDTDDTTMFATATDIWNSSQGVVAVGVPKAGMAYPLTLAATLVQLTEPISITTIAGRRYRIVYQVRALNAAAAGVGSAEFTLYDGGTSRTDIADWYSVAPSVSPQYNGSEFGAVIEGDGAAHLYSFWGRAWTVNVNIFWQPNCRFYIEDIGPVTRLPTGTPPPAAFDWTPYDARYVDPAELAAALAPPAWNTLTMNAPWSSTNPYGHDVPQWRKIGDIVYLRGTTTTATAITNATLSQLPSGARPPKPHIFAIWMSWNGAGARHAVRLWVGSDGNLIFDPTYSLPTPAVTVSNVDHLSLDGIFFSTTA